MARHWSPALLIYLFILIYADNTSLIPTYLLHISRKIKYFIPIPIVSKQWKQD